MAIMRHARPVPLTPLHTLHLEVNRDNTVAQAFYEAIGFEKRGRYFLMGKPL